MLSRAVLATTPSVEYALTDLGEELIPAIRAIVEVGSKLRLRATSGAALRRDERLLRSDVGREHGVQHDAWLPKRTHRCRPAPAQAAIMLHPAASAAKPAPAARLSMAAKLANGPAARRGQGVAPSAGQGHRQNANRGSSPKALPPCLGGAAAPRRA